MRIPATVVSFVLVVFFYFLYGWVLVPLVLPNPGSGRGRDGGEILGNPTGPIAEIEPFRHLLPEGEWELTSDAQIKMLRFGQLVVLFQNDDINSKKTDRKKITLNPCTVLMLPEQKEQLGDEETNDRIQQSVVLRADSADIVFDNDVDFSKLPLPNLVSGRLTGKVTIRSVLDAFGKPDEFSLETENIEITDSPGLTKIEAFHGVSFKLGEHAGSGSGLVLEMTPTNLSQPQTRKEISSLRLTKVTSLRFVFPEEKTNEVTTMNVLCRGRFDFIADHAEQSWKGSFYQNVDMRRNNPDKTVDQLTADQVHLTLKPKEGIDAAKVRKSPFEGLEPAVFVAHGKPGEGATPPVPARLSVKKEADVTLIGDGIYYDMQKGFMQLSTRGGAGTSKQVEMILAGQYTIRSEQSVEYTMGQNGAIGKFASLGKGGMVGKMGEGAAAKDIDLQWNELHIDQHPVAKDQIVLQLGRGVAARMAGFGTMTAGSLDLFCNYVPSNKTNTMTLDQAIVKDNVQFETAEGTCRVNQLNIFFTNIGPGGKVSHSRWMPQILSAKPPVPPNMAVESQPILQVQHLEPLRQITGPAVQTTAPLTPLYSPPAATAPAYSGRVPNQQQPATPPRGNVETQNLLGIKSSPGGGKFDMTANRMSMKVVMQNGQSSAENVDFEGNVRLKERVPNGAANTPVELVGDTVRIWNPAIPTTVIKIEKQPTNNDAIFKGKGIELYTRELNISRADNTFWSPGAGRLVGYAGQINTPGRPAASTNDKLVVEWNKEMRCNGKVLQFEGVPVTKNERVMIVYQMTTLWCTEMEIELNRQVLFFDDPSSATPEPMYIRCLHDVRVENRQLDAAGKPKSVNKMDVTKMQYDVKRNFIVAEGPGTMSSMSLGSGKGFDLAANNSAGTPASNREQLNYLAIRFQDMLEGTMLDKDKAVHVRGRIRGVYIPANSWDDTIDPDNFTAARKVGYTLECERLQVVEVPDPQNPVRSSMELTALTDAIIEDNEIYGRAQSIKYNQVNSMIYLDGGVKLRPSKQGADVSAGSIHFNIETRAIEQMRAQGVGMGF